MKKTILHKEENAFTSLFAFIENEQHRQIRSMHRNLLHFYWQIGTHINQYVSDKQIHRIGSLSKEVSADLVPQFGPIFKERQLSGMMKLAKVVQDPEHVSKLANLVSWSHISTLLLLKQWDTMLFFASRVAEHRLTIRQLRKEIRTEVLKEPFVQKKMRTLMTNGRPQAFNLTSRFSQTQPFIKNLFRDKEFLKIISNISGDISTPKPLNRNHKSLPYYQLSENLFQDITNFRTQQHIIVNHLLNYFLWNLGQTIALHWKAQSALTNMSVSLQKRYGRCFELRNLKDCYEFQRQLPDFAVATRIFYLVSWRHILELLPLSELEARLFYARLTATEGLTVREMKERISAREFEQNGDAAKHEQNIIKRLQSHVAEKYTGNVYISTVIPNEDNANYNLKCHNIFEDEGLCKFSVKAI